MPGGAESRGCMSHRKRVLCYSPHLRVVADKALETEADIREARRGKRSRPLVASAAVLFLAVVALAVWSLYRGSSIWAVEKRLECARATWGTVEQALELDGIVVRDEKVFVTPVSGTVKLVASEGEKVRVGSIIAEVAEEQARLRVELPLKKAREELAKLDAYARGRLDQLGKEVAACRLNVENEKRALARARSSGDAQGVREHTSALAEAKKALDTAVQELEREKKALEIKGQSFADKVKQCEATYRRVVFQLRAESPGVVSFELDGLEHVLSPRTCKDLGPDEARSLVPSPGRIQAGAGVDAGQPIFRLIDNYRLFVLVFPRADQVAELDSSRGLRVRFASVPGGPSLASKVFYTREAAPDGERAMLLEISGFPEDLYYRRRIRLNIIGKTVSGLVIPRRSVVHTGEGDIVYVPVNLGVVRRPVSVKAADAEWAVVEGLREGQRVVTNPSMVHETRVTIWR
ncbi:MAG: HlyD family efflux transporter periplasmic adaptor subunit [Bacillota bacterium]